MTIAYWAKLSKNYRIIVIEYEENGFRRQHSWKIRHRKHAISLKKKVLSQSSRVSAIPNVSKYGYKT